MRVQNGLYLTVGCLWLVMAVARLRQARATKRPMLESARPGIYLAFGAVLFGAVWWPDKAAAVGGAIALLAVIVAAVRRRSLRTVA